MSAIADYDSHPLSFVVSRRISIMRVLSSVVLLILSVVSAAQSNRSGIDFSVTLDRMGCYGTCRDYQVTISGDGAVRYE